MFFTSNLTYYVVLGGFYKIYLTVYPSTIVKNNTF